LAILNDGITWGWNRNVFNDKNGNFYWPMVLLKIPGLTPTVMANMMSAPFWVEVLNKITKLSVV
jgi:hypothetical protein